MSTITLTFCDCAENHVGMEKIGELSDNTISCSNIEEIANRYQNTEIIKLSYGTLPEASILVIRNGVNQILNGHYADLLAEQNALEPDKKCYMYGRVVNKLARHNLCFSNISQEAEYENKKGTIISYNNVPYTSMLKTKIDEMINVQNLQCEGNYYYDVTKCGIGYHGDTERRIVVGVRLGESMPLQFRWYKDNKETMIGKRIILNGGDMYIMSEKAVGNDWKKSSIYTLRHAAGCDKYTGR